MCDPGRGELERQLKLHDRANDLEAFLKLSENPTNEKRGRIWWIMNATMIRRLLAPFDEQTVPPGTIIPDHRKNKARRRHENPEYMSDQRSCNRRILDRLSPK